MPRRSGATPSPTSRYLKLINTLKTFFAHTYRERRLLASGLNLEPDKDSRGLQSFAALDQNKIQLVLDKGARAYNVYALSPDPKVAFCLAETASSGANAAADFEVVAAGAVSGPVRQSCSQPVVDIPAEDSTRAHVPESRLPFSGPVAVSRPSRYCSIYNRFTGIEPAARKGEYSRLELRLHIRSVGEMFQFLGDLVQYQDDIRRYLERSPPGTVKLNTPVTFGYCGDDPSPGCDDIFIRLDGQSCAARFEVRYRDREYRVANFSGDGRCGPSATAAKDHTLEILSVLHQLVGLHRSAADIRQTPTVQVLP